MKQLLVTLMILTLFFSLFWIFIPQAKPMSLLPVAHAYMLPWRDDFNYATKDEMEAAGWILSEEERISVGGGVVTLDNDGAHGCGVKYLGHFPSGIYDFSVEAKSKWIGRAYGQRVFYVWTQRHLYGWYGDGYYPEYSFIRYSDGWSGEDVKVLRFGGYAPVINEWATFTLEKKGNTFYMYEDGILKNTYTETDSAPDELVAVSISGGWISTVEYDYICMHAPKPVGGKATPINIPMNKPETPTLLIWLTTIILSLAVTVVYVKKRKRHTETNS